MILKITLAILSFYNIIWTGEVAEKINKIINYLGGKNGR
jgi:hypothetical protein